ncbi:hypothetical protein ACFPVY_17095 [Flavobacterium qiangtangense]|uniref:Uncharacterized protein n=1 Tax=Flavobacterium qiangtangense TaxID=1442595 RepID=A0ABW1PTP6_9FLAO
MSKTNQKMIFLEYDQLKETLKEAQTVISSEIINEEQMEQVKNLIELKPAEEIGKGQCLYNAYQVANATGAKIVEGIANIQVEKEGLESTTIIKHAWNILNGNQFDITKDLVWPNLSVNLKEINYLSAEEFSKSDYILDENILKFNSQVDLMATSLKFLKTKEIILLYLNSMGLDKIFYEQLLTDCINSIKEN